MGRGDVRLLEDFFLPILVGNNLKEILEWTVPGKEFRIVWKNRRNREFQVSELMLFLMWDSFKGRTPIKRGNKYLTEAKQRFRAALRKQTKITKVASKCTKYMKVYEIIGELGDPNPLAVGEKLHRAMNDAKAAILAMSENKKKLRNFNVFSNVKNILSNLSGANAPSEERMEVEILVKNQVETNESKLPNTVNNDLWNSDVVRLIDLDSENLTSLLDGILKSDFWLNVLED